MAVPVPVEAGLSLAAVSGSYSEALSIREVGRSKLAGQNCGGRLLITRVEPSLTNYATAATAIGRRIAPTSCIAASS